MLDALGNWLATFGFIELMNAYDWLWPLCEMIHFIGMALLIGSVGLLDFRVLGLFKGLPIARLEALVEATTRMTGRSVAATAVSSNNRHDTFHQGSCELSATT